MNKFVDTEPNFVALMGDALEAEATESEVARQQMVKDMPLILEKRLDELGSLVASLRAIELQPLDLPHSFHQEVLAADAIIKNAIDMLTALRMKAVVKLKTDGASIESIARTTNMSEASIKGLLIYHQNYVMPQGVSSEILSMQIKNTLLNVRARNCLEADDIKTLGDLVVRTEEEILKCPNLGPKMLDEIKAMLAKYNLALKNPKDGENHNA